ncbi:unnamed protein product [Medioppia subpectinata]|uniref:tRNA selenocysteine-associated protein 1 n=1 Tax=Medioppia subpectinata TaxID=1979941 RepID=A0A7R9L3C2_9ACAR|nr:unnamed protein product [Medioppia subpectinata]CAG2113568.1 unnamed protein product [Medioppia subpectinata]
MSWNRLNQNNGNTLWMGDVEEVMDERFIRTSFHLMSQNPTHVKVVRHKTGQAIGYAFISFESQEMALRVLRELNGQQIPNAVQGKRFRLNLTSSRDREDNEFSIYVGDLSPEVDDFTLLNAFSKHYPSTCSAKVMVSEGQSRRFGFVRFNEENDYRNALIQCNQSTILGPKPISVKAAKPRRHSRHYNIQHYSQGQHKGRPSEVVGNESYVPQPQALAETGETVYASDMNVNYAQAMTVSGQPILFYNPMMPYNALPLAYDPYSMYGQTSQYGQPVYYPNCDIPYSLIPGPIYMADGNNQYIDDKLNEEMMAKNEDLYASIESSRWSTPIDGEKEHKMQ